MTVCWKQRSNICISRPSALETKYFVWESGLAHCDEQTPSAHRGGDKAGAWEPLASPSAQPEARVTPAPPLADGARPPSPGPTPSPQVMLRTSGALGVASASCSLLRAPRGLCTRQAPHSSPGSLCPSLLLQEQGALSLPDPLTPASAPSTAHRAPPRLSLSQHVPGVLSCLTLRVKFKEIV